MPNEETEVITLQLTKDLELAIDTFCDKVSKSNPKDFKNSCTKIRRTTEKIYGGLNGDNDTTREDPAAPSPKDRPTIREGGGIFSGHVRQPS